MAGVPVDDLTPYLAALVERGYRVAVAEQSETDAGDIEREIERVVTPGTLLASTDADPGIWRRSCARPAATGGWRSWT